MAGAGSGFGPRAVWGFHPQTPGTLRWGDFLSDEKGTKESPEGQGRRFPHRQSGFLSSSGLVPADEVLFPVSLGGASFFLNDQKETKESPGVGRGWLSAQRAGLGQSACTPGPPLRARGRQLKCQHSFSASEPRRCAGSSDGLCPPADRVTAAFRTQAAAWLGGRQELAARFADRRKRPMAMPVQAPHGGV